ncbi:MULTISPECIES: hypothetical protein [Achromobacter]|uniref:Uncharacterized protein n=1 Tax=Achromobacter seleniivolatilans TaxID=3047478 RepID=A0ABY9LYZ4_9BURK|nr:MULTISPECIES: hypothetical protein [Achromobacter]WMD19665.1 hypothetical protein RAS12_24065 [Achromobacter sp. R39]
MTNVECVADLMEFSSYGPLAQMFVVDALLKHATTVAELSDAELEAWPENPLFHVHSWRGVAQEIKRKLEKHLGEASA